ncbi:hypothetical protein EsH8_I_000545 [Colletotrichum jinshuiense]
MGQPVQKKLPGSSQASGTTQNGSTATNGTAAATSPSVLENFKGTFKGNGFNTIFRPNSEKTPTEFKPKLNPPEDNVLQLSLTEETQTFTKMNESIANRGFVTQPDIFLDGWNYTQSVIDVTTPSEGTPGIHFESGFWLSVPESGTPDLGASLARMASIPHGTTINAQSFLPAVKTNGAPIIPKSPITPFVIGKTRLQPFPSQTAAKNGESRIPQDLTPFIKANTITQEMIDDPNSVLDLANKGKEIINNTSFTVSTESARPGTTSTKEAGGGTNNIGFLAGNDDNDGNAKAVKVTATYWVSTVNAKLNLKPFKPTPAKPSQTFSPVPLHANEVVPTFSVDFEIPTAKTVNVQYTQIQYSQNVILNFGPLSWPHVSVATLVPVDVQELQPSILRQ